MTYYFPYSTFHTPNMLNIIGYRKYFFAFSAVMIFLSVIALVKWNLNYSIDFTGGAVSEVVFSAAPDVKAVREVLENPDKNLGLDNFVVTPTGANSVFIKTKTLDEETHQKMIAALAEKFQDAKEIRFDSIGAVIGQEMKQKAIWAIITVAIGISLYVAWAFRKVTRPISSWKYGVVSVVTLFHDVIVPIGLFAFLGHYRGVQVDLTFIVAVLTILGYSINDTIVVFDRTRENLLRYNIREFEQTVNKSLNQTLIRSINTSLTVIIVLVSLYFFGGETLKYFALALLIGVGVGTYSSIFIASPLLVEWHKRGIK